jgi:ParB-like chromosome segregation protein Spo0J
MIHLMRIVDLDDANPAFAVRESLDPTLVEGYRAVLDETPPIVAYTIPGQDKPVVTDGHTRLAAARLEGRTHIRVELRAGSRADAQDHAAAANTRHGKRLSAEETRRQILPLADRHPDWDRTRLARHMGISERTVERALAARRVLQTIAPQLGAPLDPQVSARHLAEISRAPEKHWAPLARAAERRGWTDDEMAAAVQNLRADDIPDWRKNEILAGVADPLHHTGNGSYSVLPATLRRETEKAQDSSAALALLRAAEALARLAQFSATAVARSLAADDRHRLLHGAGSLEQYLDCLHAIRDELEKEETR